MIERLGRLLLSRWAPISLVVGAMLLSLLDSVTPTSVVGSAVWLVILLAVSIVVARSEYDRGYGNGYSAGYIDGRLESDR